MFGPLIQNIKTGTGYQCPGCHRKNSLYNLILLHIRRFGRGLCQTFCHICTLACSVLGSLVLMGHRLSVPQTVGIWSQVSRERRRKYSIFRLQKYMLDVMHAKLLWLGAVAFYMFPMWDHNLTSRFFLLPPAPSLQGLSFLWGYEVVEAFPFQVLNPRVW